MDRNEEEEEEGAPLLGAEKHKKRNEEDDGEKDDGERVSTKRPFHNERDEERGREEDNNKEEEEKPLHDGRDEDDEKHTTTSRSSSRFRRRREQSVNDKKTDEREDGDHDEEGDGERRGRIGGEEDDEGDHQGVINEDKDESDNKNKRNVKKNDQPSHDDGCCFPVAICFSSCFTSMGFGFKKHDVRDPISQSGRQVDMRMWNMVKKSKAFKGVEDSSFCINISRLSDLQGVLGSAVKPFVKVHIVNIDTGHYIRPAANGKKATMARSAPVLTRQASLPGSSSDIPKWEEEIHFPGLTFKDVVSPDNLILLELLDDPPSLSFRKARSLKNAKSTGGTANRTYTTLAWAFLLPVGQQVNVGYPKTTKSKKEEGEKDDVMENCKRYDMSLRLQLYRYQVDTVATRLQRVAYRWPSAELDQQKQRKTETSHRYPDDIPEVYFQYKRKSLKVLVSVLELATGYRPIADFRSDDNLGDLIDSDAENQNQDLDPRSSQAAEDQAKAQLRAAKMKRSRATNEPCVIPNKLLHRVDGGPEGAMVVSFSNKGHLLAVAGAAPGGSSAGSSSVSFAPVGGTSPYGASTYSVRLFDSDTGVEVWSDLYAHFGVIYDIKWSLSDAYFLTCSSDGCCKIWRMSNISTDNREGGGDSSPRRRASSIQAKQNRRRNSVSGMGIQASVAVAGFQDTPTLIATLAHNPPVYVYAAIFQEYSLPNDGKVEKVPPQVITGAADGRIRVWKGTNLLGDITIGEGGNKQQQKYISRSRRGSICEGDIDTDYWVDPNDVPHYGEMVQALAIDPRSKYLFSGDSGGAILIWRADKAGWYQLLRKFRKDDLHGRSISSLSVYPSRAKGYLLVLALPALTSGPEVSSLSQGLNRGNSNKETSVVLSSSLLKMYDLGTYKAQHSFPGVVINNSFCRATFSADGRYATCGTIIRSNDGSERNHIRFWDTLTGRYQETKIATLPYSYIPRSIAWHPKQHVVAVAMAGHGAAVGIYCANKARAEDVVNVASNNGESGNAETISENTPPPRSTSVLSSSPGRLRSTLRKTWKKEGEGGNYDSDEVRTKEERTARTREILDKIRAAKARARGETK